MRVIGIAQVPIGLARIDDNHPAKEMLTLFKSGFLDQCRFLLVQHDPIAVCPTAFCRNLMITKYHGGIVLIIASTNNCIHGIASQKKFALDIDEQPEISMDFGLLTKESFIPTRSVLRVYPSHRKPRD